MDRRECVKRLREMKVRWHCLDTADKKLLELVKRNFADLCKHRAYKDVVHPLIHTLLYLVERLERASGIPNVSHPVTNLKWNYKCNAWVLEFDASPDILVFTSNSDNPKDWTCFPVNVFPEKDYVANQVSAVLEQCWYMKPTES